MPGCRFFRLIILTALLFSARGTLYCQETEDDIREKAAQLFDQERYVEATPLYLRLLALNPRSHDYNFRYGTCLLYNSYKKQDAFKYLNYSISDPAIDIQAYFFLGKAFHLNYQFNEAIKNYELYKQKSAGKPRVSFEVDRQVEMCQNGKRLLTTITDIVVLEKKEIDRAGFFRLYNLENIGGDLIVGAAFQSKADKKKGHVPLIHIGANAGSLYYSSYGESDTGQKDIYVRRKLPDGNWGAPQAVAGNVNSKYDEDFPYMHPGGQYLYFSSKGHNSMGGYDVFRSKLNAETGAFGPPENMDFAVSSPDDDIFYIADSLDQNAYFASARQSNNGKLFVYKVRVDRVPLQLAVIKGSFSSVINPENKKLSITVTDFANGEKIGTFATNEKSAYLITLPKGGKYKYEMKVDGKPDVHTYVVNVPFFKEFHPLKQKIVEEKGETGDVVRVTDLFNDAVDDPVGILAEVIKSRSELNPNAAQFDMKSLDADKENEKILAGLGFKNATPESVAAQFEELARKKEAAAAVTESLLNGALDKAIGKLGEAAALQEKAKNQVARASNSETKQAKYEQFSEAEKSVERAAQLKSEAKTLIAFADSLSKKLPAEKASAAKIGEVRDEIKAAVTNGNTGELKNIVTRNTETIAAASVPSEDPVEKLVAEKSAIAKEKKEIEAQQASYSASAQKLEAEIRQLTESLATAKSRDQATIRGTIDSRTSELNLVNEERIYQDKKLERITARQDETDRKIAFLQDVTKVDKKTPVPAAAVAAKFSEVDSKNNNTLAAYIDQQIGLLENDPQVKTSANDNTAALLEDDYEKQAAAIKNSTDAPLVKKRRRAELDQLVAENAGKELAEIESKLNQNPSDAAAIQRKKELTAIKELAAASRDKQISEISAEERQMVAVIPDPAAELKLLDPDYEQKIQRISGTEKSVLEQQNKVDESLISKINAELLRVEEALKNSPADKQAEARKTALETLKSSTGQAIAERTKKIQSFNPQENPPAVSVASELKRIDPDYENSVSSVSADKRSGLEQLNAIDNALIDKIDQQLALTDEKLRETPDDESLKGRKAALNTLRGEKTTDITRRTERLKELEAKQPAIAATPQSERDQLAPDYQSKMAAANSASAGEALLEKNEIDKALLQKVADELGEVEGQLLRNPGNKTAKERQAALEQLKLSTEELIAQRELELKKIAAETQSDNTISANDIRPGYESALSTISSRIPPGQERESAILKEEAALLRDIGTALSRAEERALKNPGNETLEAEISQLRELQAVQEATVAEKQSDLTAVAASAIDREKLVASVSPKYSRNTQADYETTGQRAAALANEEQLQRDLIRRSEANTKKLSKTFDVSLAAENKVIADLLQESAARSEAVKNPQDRSAAVSNAIAADLGSDAELLMRSKPETIEQAKRIITELKEYENQLDEQLNALKIESPESTGEQLLTEGQLTEVRRRVGIVTADLDAMENYVVPVTAEVEQETGLVRLTNRENELISRKSQPGISTSEAKSIEKELREVQAQKEIAAKAVTTAKIGKTDAGIAELQDQLASGASKSELAAAVLNDTKAIGTAVSGKKTTSRTLTEELQRKQEANTLMRTTADFIRLEKEYDEKGIVTENPAQLAEQKRRFVVEIGQLEAAGNDYKNDPSKSRELQEISDRRAALEKAVDKLDEMIANLEKENSPATLSAALGTEVTFEEEAEIQQKSQYQSIVAMQENVKMRRRELSQLKRERETLRNAISAESGAEKRNALVNALVESNTRIAAAEKLLSVAEENVQRAIAASGLPEEKTKNLLVRDVPYKAPVQLTEMLAPGMKTGFNLVEKPSQTRTESLPVGVKAPSGLVYRVQVGAYAKALPENLFTEFTPVTGEKLNNGITRYMAGYFGNRLKANDAQKAIRGLGYTDAFVVAYCDGERISVAEARRLEESGLCVPKNQDSLMLEVAGNRIALLPADSLAKLRPAVKKSDYNKAPGAAPADAVEEKPGLFFTVQVGVYNRPATPAQLRNITPLVTRRLPNGQIRYSSGIFRSLESARPKRVEAVTRGITDAFITAYYKGERISVDEALRLLEENGESILEKDEVTVLSPGIFEEARLYASEQPLKPSVAAMQPVQLVSSRTYDHFPADELSRLNTYGAFHYNPGDGRIRSDVYPSAAALPSLDGITESIDTIFQKSETGRNFEPGLPLVVAEWGGASVNGAFGDWILRTGLQHRAIVTKDGLRFEFEGVQPKDREALIGELQGLGAALVSIVEALGEEIIISEEKEK